MFDVDCFDAQIVLVPQESHYNQ